MNKSEFIPSKRKPKKLKLAEPAEIPQDLKDKWNAVQACATTFNTLQAGHFTYKYHVVLEASLEFLKKLHEQAVADAIKHPQAHLIPELKAALEEIKAVDSGKEQ